MTRCAVALALVLAACGSGDDDSSDAEPFDVSGYDRACAAADECVLIYSGDPCGCDCAMTAIAIAERMSFSDDREAYIAEACPDGGLVCGPCPPTPGVACSDGMCSVVP